MGSKSSEYGFSISVEKQRVIRFENLNARSSFWISLLYGNVLPLFTIAIKLTSSNGTSYRIIYSVNLFDFQFNIRPIFFFFFRYHFESNHNFFFFISSIEINRSFKFQIEWKTTKHSQIFFSNKNIELMFVKTFMTDEWILMHYSHKF